MVYRVAVCDDNRNDAEYVKTLTEQWAISRQLSVETEVFSSAESYLFHAGDTPAFDLLLLDIEMGHMDGVSLARRIRQENDRVQIVFITGYSDYIAEGYDVAALHYLMKPLDSEKFFHVLDRAAEKLEKDDRCLNLDLHGEMMRIPLREILYLDVRGNYVTIHGKEEYTIKSSLSTFETQLAEGFWRVGRSVILNLNHVRRVTKTEIRLTDGTVLPLPRGAYEPLQRAIIAYT